MRVESEIDCRGKSKALLLGKYVEILTVTSTVENYTIVFKRSPKMNAGRMKLIVQYYAIELKGCIGL